MAFQLDSTAPAAIPGKKNLHWQYDTTVSPTNVSGYFDQDLAVSSVSTSGTVSPAAVETEERVTTGSSTITRTLPAATGSLAIIVVKKVDSGSGNVSVAAAGSDTIDGSPSVALTTQYQYVRLIDAASGKWDVIGSTSSGSTAVENELVTFSGTSGTLANTPISSSLKLYRNGMRLTPTTDYTISGATITLVVTAGTDAFLADYRK